MALKPIKNIYKQNGSKAGEILTKAIKNLKQKTTPPKELGHHKNANIYKTSWGGL